MEIKLIAYGIAKEILDQRTMNYHVEDGVSIAELKENLVSAYPDFGKLRYLSFAVDEEYRDDDFKLSENQEVVIIPPVSGG